jgi:hypothetical protein
VGKVDKANPTTTDIGPFISWPGILAIFVALIAAIFIGWVIWRRQIDNENTPSAAFWSFAIFVGLIFVIPLVPELISQLQHVKCQLGSQFSCERTQITNDEAREALAAALTKVLKPPTAPTATTFAPTWVLFGEGDCGDSDFANSSGVIPDTGKCSMDRVAQTAVCWDGVTYSNNPSPTGNAAWCTYKTTQTE